MTPRLLAALATAAIALAPSLALAQAPSFAIDQLYSNADGSVQFMVLRETQGQDGQTAFAGLTLRSTGAGVPKNYTFPRNLPSAATANARVLVGTRRLPGTRARRDRLHDSRPLRAGRRRHALVRRRGFAHVRVASQRRRARALPQRRARAEPRDEPRRPQCFGHRAADHRRRVLQRDARPLLREPARARHRRARHRPLPRLGAHRPHVRRMAHRRRRRSRREPGVPLLHPAAEGRLALLLGLARRVRRRRAQDRHRPELRRVRLRDARRRSTSACRTSSPARARRAPYPSTGCGTNAPTRTTATRPTARSATRWSRRAGKPEGYGPDPVAMCAPFAGSDTVVKVTDASPYPAELLEPHRHALRRFRGRALCGDQPARPEPPDRRLAAGPLEQRRRPRQRYWRLVRRWTHLVARRRPVHGLRRRQRRQRRRLGSRERPVGDLRSGRHRPPGRAGADRQSFAAGFEERHRGEPLDRRGAHVEQSAER